MVGNQNRDNAECRALPGCFCVQIHQREIVGVLSDPDLLKEHGLAVEGSEIDSRLGDLVANIFLRMISII